MYDEWLKLSRLPNRVVVVGVAATYFFNGGRLSIAVAFVLIYMMAHREMMKAGIDEVTKVKTTGEKSSCCSGKSGGCGSTNAVDGSKKKTKGCCGGACKSKGGKSVEIKKNNVDESSYPIAIDFTNAFKAPGGGSAKVKKVPKLISGQKSVKKADGLVKQALTISKEKLLASQVYVFYSSLQGMASRSARRVVEILKKLEKLEKEPLLMNLDEIDDLNSYFVDVPDEAALYIFVVPSYDSDSPLDYFLETMQENFNDFRIDKYPLSKLVGYTVLGVGDSESWPEKFCYQAKDVDEWIAKLGGRRIYPLGRVCVKFGGDPKVEEWAELLAETLKDDEPILYEYDESVDDKENQDIDAADDSLVDLEDIGGSGDVKQSSELKKMVAKDGPTYKNLVKQGYAIVGSHSGVKICRWTKSDLRGRGSCYKHSLFNIVSSRCMELTTSLACSSKCVFCWRHGTNPVAKNWRWEVDEPDYILENALQAHYSKIKQMRGVPNVVAERFALAFKVAHCALSLVGEPIMYPYINRFVKLLHEKHISSFLVCNAQHPEQLENLGKVTQLYISIDAPTKQELKKIDRPLFSDFWERMLRCLEILRTTQSHQRTVFRLTLLKGFNMADASAYVDLVMKARPCFIEVKGATFCGSSDGNGNPLTMQNIPFNEECVKFVKCLTSELQKRYLNYDVAAEHAHSNTILIADTKFKKEDGWYTHIDFERFFELLKSGEPFTNTDYMAKTPEWALFGNGGFAPGNVRFYRKKKNANKEVTVA
ncbi:HER091Cp [Eremothecium sinecaudum]|uniref:S-adenosyl-L-methionine-dependent tRNA 4-demethylwyosine synthase n=1 Tax=Eremothecium sinecaudum TaxID=45286 RepID=A0A0X8HTU6_9SACH|nr:HER091Cp [Eremothecium sinecaudum]AMD21370.1 HER091Cp [Eremothecium sinecaudum]